MNIHAVAASGKKALSGNRDQVWLVAHPLSEALDLHASHRRRRSGDEVHEVHIGREARPWAAVRESIRGFIHELVARLGG
jgi:hypothetical protein